MALAGVAVFSVAKAGCAEPGRYVQHDNGQVELVDSCLDPAHLPKPKHKDIEHDTKEPAEPALNELGRTDPIVQAP
ncbi:MAG TPA: hypothetical protein VHH34_08070 [Pseudonocardiaceae bacterium]|nr:hypothetical protein [Pseudonocardiaceae bacterium]